MQERHGGAQRSQSRAAAGPVVGGLEAPGAHQGRGAWGLRKVRNAGAFRARRGGRGVQRHGPAGCLCSCERLSQEPLSERHLDVHRRALQPPHGPAPRHSEHARALESRACSRRLHRRAGVDRRRRGGFRGLAGRQKGVESCGTGGWTCTTSPSASMLAGTTWSNPTRAACGPSQLTFPRPMLGRRSTGKRWKKPDFRCRSVRRSLQLGMECLTSRMGNAIVLGPRKRAPKPSKSLLVACKPSKSL